MNSPILIEECGIPEEHSARALNTSLAIKANKLVTDKGKVKPLDISKFTKRYSKEGFTDYIEHAKSAGIYQSELKKTIVVDLYKNKWNKNRKMTELDVEGRKKMKELDSHDILRMLLKVSEPTKEDNRPFGKQIVPEYQETPVLFQGHRV